MSNIFFIQLPLLTVSHFYEIIIINLLYGGYEMDKSEENKKEKETKLLNTAFTLFTTNGIKNTSIQDIVDNAGVAKGTFYLYFKDKYDIRDKAIERASKKLFCKALTALQKSYINNFVIFIINYVVDELNRNKILLQFIAKDLSFGVFNHTIQKLSSPEDDNENLIDFFNKKAIEHNKKYDNPEIVLFTIIELVGSTCFNSILHQIPVSINEYKPFLYNVIRKIL